VRNSYIFTEIDATFEIHETIEGSSTLVEDPKDFTTYDIGIPAGTPVETNSILEFGLYS
jgi:hypothetical protein